MTLLARMVIRTTGFAGAPGINVWHFSEGTLGGGAWGQSIVDGLYDEVGSVLSAIKNIGSPNSARAADPELAIIDAATGQLVDAKTPTAAPTVYTTPGNEPGDLPRAVAALARFQTDRFINGRRLKGRAFIGPLSGSSMDGEGNCNGTTIAVIQDAFVAITTGVGPRLAVYSRPKPLGVAGEWGDVLNVNVRTTPSHLESRSV